RVQAASRGWPVLGDRLYGASRPFGPETPDERDRPIALHARQLTFLHPIRYEPVTVVAPLPETWRALGLPQPPPGGRSASKGRPVLALRAPKNHSALGKLLARSL